MLKLRRAVGITSDDNTEGTSVPQRIAALETQVFDNLIVAVNNNTKSTAALKIRPKLAVCITMYNENESELKTTLEGVIQNYNVMYSDKKIAMRQQDIVVV